MKKKEICLISCLFVIFLLGFMSTLVKGEEFDSTINPETIVNTPVGTNVEVSDEETGVNITFSEITNEGITDVEKSVEGPEPPSDFIAVSDYYDITTNATFLGAIKIAIPYVETQIYANEQLLRFLHWDPTVGWLDISSDVDPINNIMYAEVLQLSKFLIAEIILENNESLIVRDNFGVPHVFANQKEGLGFGVGYAMAQDRLWQMDWERRKARGTLAEFISWVSLDSDYNTRSIGYSRQELLDMFYDWVPTKPNTHIKEMMLAYVDGVNQYIEEALEAYEMGDESLIPVEYLPGVATPEGLLPIAPWSIEDSVAVIIRMINILGRTGGNELLYARELQGLQEMHGNSIGWDIFNDVFPQVDPGAPVTIPSEGSEYTDIVEYSSISNLPNNLNIQNELQESLDLTIKSGSNAWVVSPEKSTNGNTLQLGGLQVGLSIPALFIEVGIHGAGISADGMMIPGVPFILTGANEHGAWTMTTGTSDLVDTYIEVLNPDNPHQYWHNGGWVNMEHRIERFYGYKRLYYEERDIWRTIHGIIIGWDLDNNLCFTQKVPFFKNEIAAVEGWMLFQDAKNVVDAEEACKNIDINNNFLWADNEGDIGYWHTGKFPIKPTHGRDKRPIDDRLPLWGTGEEEWIGFTSFEEMPKCVNPEQSYLVNWNNKPKADWPYREVDWGEVSKVTWIQRQLSALENVSFEDMKEINRNTGYNHIDGMYFLDFLINATKNDPDIPIEVIAALETWDHHYNDVLEPTWPAPDATYDDPGLTIFDAWLDKFENEVFNDDLPPYPPAHSQRRGTLLHVLDGENSKLSLNYDYLNGESRDVVIVRVLKEVLVELAAKYGTEVSTWLTPIRQWWFSSMGALPSPVMHYMNRGSFNHIAEMQEYSLPYVENILPPGQSGFMNNLYQYPHAYDQKSLYETWNYKPVHFKYQKIKEVAESEMILIKEGGFTPVARDDYYSVDEEDILTIFAPGVMGNDYGVGGDLSHVIVDVGPLHGILTLNADGSFTYVPEDNYNGVDTFTYILYATAGAYNYGTVSIMVNNINDAPLANDDSATLNEDTYTIVNVLANDSDIDGDTLTIYSVGSPSSGTAFIYGGFILYYPNVNFNGLDTFTYTISDGMGGTATATITITVIPMNDAPVANDDSGITDEDTAINIDVLDNDSDIDGDTLTIYSVGSPSSGTAIISGGQIIYTPNANFNGFDTFLYTISDGMGGTATATVAITVIAVNDAPVAVNDIAITDEDIVVTIDILANDGDIDGDLLSIVNIFSISGGQVVDNGDGTVTFTPNPDYVGIAYFNYTVSDGQGGTDTSYCSIIILDKTPPVTTFIPEGHWCGEWYRQDVLIAFTASDLHSGVAKIEYSYDGLNWLIYSTPFNPPLQQDVTIYYRSTDGVGNVEATKSISLKLLIMPIIIDDTGTGDFTWAELALEDWCSGSGTWNDPYLIEDLIFDNQEIDSCIIIRNSEVPFIIRNCEVINSAKSGYYYAGIKLNNVKYGTITGCTLTNNEVGIYLINSDYNVITDNIITNNKGFGILLKNSDYNEILWNHASYNQGSGIDLGSYGTCHYNKIIGNIANNNAGFRGLKLFGHNNNVSYNTFSNNYIGITSEGRNNTFMENFVNGNSQYGMQISRSRDLRILNNAINDTYQSYGIYFWRCHDNSIEGKMLAGNKGGILFDECSHNIINRNNIINNEIGLKINGFSDFNLIYNNRFIKNGINAEDNSFSTFQKYLLEDTVNPATVPVCTSVFGSTPVSPYGDWWFTNAYKDDDGEYLYLRAGLFFDYPGTIRLKWGEYNDFDDSIAAQIYSISINYEVWPDSWPLLDTSTNLMIHTYDNEGHSVSQMIAAIPIDERHYTGTITINSGDVFNTVKAGGFIKYMEVSMFCNEIEPNSWINVDYVDIYYNYIEYGQSSNQWDNGTIGNYWADYPGVDYDDDGIGDTPYIISGTAGSQDNFPIWDDGSTPVASDDSYSVDEDHVLTILIPGVMGNDYDADGDLSYVILDVGPLHGSLILNLDGSFTYEPEENYNGNDTFTYIVYDTVGAYDYGNVSIIINAVNDSPVAGDAMYSINEDEQLNLPVPGILTYIYDVEGDPLVVILVTGVTNGTLTMNTDGSFLYIPDANFYGDVWFEYKANDGLLDSNTAFVTINVVSVNDDPVAVKDEAITNEDTAVTIDVLSNDYDIEDDTLSIIDITVISGGLVVDNGNGTVTYYPALDFVGIAIFNYTISDGQGGTDTAPCLVTVLDTTPPETMINYIGEMFNLVHLGEFWYLQDVVIELSAYDAGVGVSYTEYSFNNIDWNTYSDPFNVPFEGKSTIYYRSMDNTGNLEEILNSTINIVYSPFVIDDGDGGDYTWLEVLEEPWCNGSGTEIDPYIIENLVIVGDIFYESCIEILNSDVYFIIRNCTLLGGKAGVLLQNVNNGTLMYNYLHSNADGIKLENSFWNNITVNYLVENKNTGIYLLSSNNNTISNCTLYFNLYGIVLNSSHSNIICYNHLEYNKIGIDMENSHYNIIYDNTIISPRVKRSDIAIKDDGCYNYISSNTIQGCEIGIELIDSIGTEIIINTFIENDVAIILSTSVENKIEGNTFLNNDDYAVVLTDNSIENSIFKNEFIENNEGEVQAYDDSGSNHWTDENGIGNYWSDYEERYPDAGGEENTWEDAYVIDGDLDVSDEGSQVNPPPVTTDDTYSVLEDNMLSVEVPGVMENDYDGEGDLSHVTLDVGPLHGTLMLSADGDFTYDPDDDYNGDDMFTYKVYDTEGAYDYGMVIITIIAVNDAPVAVDDSAITDEDTAVIVNVLTNDSDVDEDTLIIDSVTPPTWGIAEIIGDLIKYTPYLDLNYSGDDSFTYTISDGNGAFATASVSVTILDKTPPKTTLTIQGPSNGSHPTYISTDTYFELDASDNLYGVGVDRIEYQINFSGWNTYETSFNLMYKGSYIISYRSVDLADNFEVEKTLWVVVNGVMINYTGEVYGIYSDPVFLKANLTDIATQLPISGRAIVFTIGTQKATAETDSYGIATISLILDQPEGTYPVFASFAGDEEYLSSDSEEHDFTINKECAYAEYTGNTVVPEYVEITLRATVFDDDDGNWGDLTKINVTFTILDSLSLSTIKTIGPVEVETTTVEGVGVAEITILDGFPEGDYIVQISFDPHENDYYTKGDIIIPVALIIYKPEGDFVTGGGWIEDMSGNKGNFGFNVKYKNNGLPKGQALYIYREGDYLFIVKANAWVGMAINPNENYSIFEAKCNIKKVHAETGLIDWEAGNYQLVVEVWDHSQDGKEDVFQIRVYDNRNGLIFYESGYDPYGFLGGGNIVIHIDKKK